VLPFWPFKGVRFTLPSLSILLSVLSARPILPPSFHARLISADVAPLPCTSPRTNCSAVLAYFFLLWWALGVAGFFAPDLGLFFETFLAFLTAALPVSSS